MASAFTHAFFAGALGTVMVPSRGKLITLGALYAVTPDLDVVAFAFGIPYADRFGHRGLSHSLAFAVVAAALLTWAWTHSRRSIEAGSRAAADGVPSIARATSYLFLAIASHGVLDALTNGGLGVAFFAPFSDERYFFAWRPIVVSPIAVRSFFSERGLAVLASELVVVWVPTAATAAVAFALRRSQSSS